jgi:hypothetical protein
MQSPEVSLRENRFLTGIFVVALLYNVYGVTYHWTMGYMSGHEFRQALTAVVAYHIDRQDNFSLLYETPVLGKPWVCALLEVPLYQWSVVGLSRATGLPHVEAARTITATCFYLTLPAIYLLLGRLAVPKPRRLLMLALVLTAPVYIYYSRAFLMDSMALMCSAWFLLGFVRTMDRRHRSWLGLTIVTGTAAALIKSAILAVWMLPAAAYGAWMLWRDLRARTGWAAPLQTLLWGLATVAVALGCLRTWITYTDPIKAAHASAWIFTAKNLSLGNWGLFDLGALFSADLWRHLLHCWEQALMSRWLILLGLIAGLALPAVRWRVLGTVAPFFLAQFLFPFAYAYQDYYFYACAVFLHVALGFTLLGVLDSRWPRWGVALVFLVPFGAQVTAYWQDYRQGQSTWHQGGFEFTELLRDMTPENSVLIVAGADWAAMTPLYAQRKALMIRSGLEYDRNYLDRAFNDLAGEEVSALVVFDHMRTDRNFIDLVAARFDLTAATPTLSFITADIYVSRLYAEGIQARLRNSQSYPHLTLPSGALKSAAPVQGPMKIPAATASTLFREIRPAPYQVDLQFGLDWLPHGQQRVLSVHPNSDLWIKPPATATQIRWSFGLFSGAYENPAAHTNGVEFIIEGEMPDGQVRTLYYRLLDPMKNPADQGDQQADLNYAPQPGEVLRFSTRPNQNSSFDWAYTILIRVQ